VDESSIAIILDSGTHATAFFCEGVKHMHMIWISLAGVDMHDAADRG
jgi:hypothetical protein